MIEITFSDSACGSLKVAQRFGEGEYQGGCIGVSISRADGSKPSTEETETAQREAEEKARKAWDGATPLGGNPADVFGFNLALSIGDISDNRFDYKRKQALEWLYSVYPNDVGKQAVQDILNRINVDLDTVRERISTGELTRIWYSNQPDDMCGLYWFMWQLNQWESNNVNGSVVKLPEWEIADTGNIVMKTGCGEVTPEEWSRYLDLQRQILPSFVTGCASHWKTLQDENAPLRVVLNGRLVSTPENLYDDIIHREIDTELEAFHEAMIIGRILGKYQLGISDAWVAIRIDNMIQAGTLEVVSEVAEDVPVYHRMLKKCAC